MNERRTEVGIDPDPPSSTFPLKREDAHTNGSMRPVARAVFVVPPLDPFASARRS
jgi:hypothetical protein